MRYKLGFIGFGKMAQAIWAGIKSAKLLTNEDVTYFDINSDINSPLKANNLFNVFTCSDMVIFAIKPQQIDDLLSKLPKENAPLMISILAGTKSQVFTQAFGDRAKVVRIMPNTPALIGEGISALYANEHVSQEEQKDVFNLFESVGKVVLVNEEHMDTVTGISGSGPAFIYKIADAIAKKGEEQGLSYETSLQLIAQTMVGAGKMLQESGKDPATLIKDVTSPGGTTQAGLEIFDQSPLVESIQSVIDAAISRSKELGQ